MTRHQWCAALLSCCALASPAWAARVGPSASALFLTRPEGAQPGLDALAGTIRTRYGVSDPFVERAKPSSEIEAQIFAAMVRVPVGGSLFVVVDLELIDQKAGGRILRTPDYDADLPLTGLPLASIRRISTSPIAGSMILVFPDCGSGRTESPSFSTPSTRTPLTLLTFCPLSEATRQDFYRALATLLDAKTDHARVPVDDIARKLASEFPAEQVSVETTAGGGWLLPAGRKYANDTSLNATGLHVRAAAVRSTGATKNGVVTDDILQAATEPESDVRREVMVVLGRADDTSQVMPVLQHALNDEDAEVRAAAVYAIGQHWGRRTSPADDSEALAVHALTQDEAPPVRAGAYWALAKGRRQEVAPDLRRIAEDDPQPMARMAALEALAELPDSDNVPTLSRIARNADAAVGQRVGAIRALARVDTPESADVLLGLVADSQSSVSAAATKNVGAMRYAPPSARALAQDPDTRLDQRQLAIRLVGREESTDAATLLIELLRGQNPDVRREAAVALRAQSQPATTQTLLAMLEDENLPDDQRAAAADALHGTTSSEAYEALEEATGKHSPPAVRKAALAALPTVQAAPSKTRTYEKAARDKDSDVRVAAVEGLGARLGRNSADQNAGTRQSLENLATNSNDAKVREVASEALRIGASREAFLKDLHESGDPPDDVTTSSSSERRRWRIDIFWCEGEHGDALELRSRRVMAELARFAETTRDGPDVFDPEAFRIRKFGVERNALPGYQVASDEVRYDAGNPIEALWAQRLLLYAGPTFTAKGIGTATPNYLSVFVCATNAVL